MQRKRVGIVGKPKFDLCWRVFDIEEFGRTVATRFQFEDDYSGEGGIATRCSVLGFQP